MSKVEVLVFSSGERYPMLFDEDGMPDYWVTLYTTEVLRVKLTASAIENTIGDIKHLMLWEEIEGRYLISEFSKGEFLGNDDINSIRDHCLLDARALRKSLKKKTGRNVIALSHLYPASSKNIPSVSTAHFANRLAHIADFLYFIARTMLRQRTDFADLCEAIDAMKDKILAQKTKVITPKGDVGDTEFKAPPQKVFDALMRVVKVDSPDNSYKNPTIRERNELIIEVMYETGIRAGELLALQVGDIDFQQGVVNIVRRHDNPDELRKRQPVVKTLGRPIPIKEELAARIRHYIMEVRAIIPGANKHPFLFVTHKKGEYQGRSISNSTFTARILKPAVARFPDMFEEIKRHGFRHNFNERLSKRIDAQNAKARANPELGLKVINEKEEIQIRKQLNGWDSDSTAETYNLRHIKEMADKLMRQDMESQNKNLKKGK